MTVSEQSGKLSHITIRGTLWTYAGYYSGRLVILLSTIILARLLSKDDFGVVGYAVTVISFLEVIKDLGIGASLIYHQESEKASVTAFWLNLATGLGLFILVWALAPLVGAFFHDPRAISVTRAMAFNFPLSALGSTHEALLAKQLAFKRKFIPGLAQAISKGLFSIGLALLGFGPWSLVVGQIIGNIVSAIVLWSIVPWRPSLGFARDQARTLLQFGTSMAGVNLTGVFVLNIDYLLVGRYLGAVSLGIYTLAFRIPEMAILQFCSVVAQVVFPVLSKIRDDRDALIRGFLRTSRYVSLLTVPLGLGIALLSKPFVLAVFTEKWAEVAPVMSAIAIYGLVLSLGFNAGDVYKAQGRPVILTRISLVKAVLLVPALMWAVKVPATPVAVGWVQASVALIGSLLNLIILVRMLKVPLWDILEAWRPAIFAGLFLCLGIWGTLLLTRSASNWIQLITGTLIGGSFYAGALALFQRELTQEAFNVVQKAVLRKE